MSGCTIPIGGEAHVSIKRSVEMDRRGASGEWGGRGTMCCAQSSVLVQCNLKVVFWCSAIRVTGKNLISLRDNNALYTTPYLSALQSRSFKYTSSFICILDPPVTRTSK